MGYPALRNCWAFYRDDDEGRQDNCFVCGHNWKEHMHITYRTFEETLVVEDHDIARELKLNRTEAESKAIAIAFKRRLIAGYESEGHQIQEAIGQFSFFLSKNSITTSNDATTAYLDHLIKEGQIKVQRHAQTCKRQITWLKTRELKTISSSLMNYPRASKS